MKFIALVFTAFLAMASAEAAAALNPAAVNSEAVEEYCNSSGQPCDKFKRAASAVADANAEPKWAKFPHLHCYRVGEPCYKAKRDASAMAEALVAAHLASEPEGAPESADEYCNGADGPCTMVKRAAEAIAQLMQEPEEKPKEEKRHYAHHHCFRVGEPCYRRKRALEYLAAAVAKI